MQVSGRFVMKFVSLNKERGAKQDISGKIDVYTRLWMPVKSASMMQPVGQTSAQWPQEIHLL